MASGEFTKQIRRTVYILRFLGILALTFFYGVRVYIYMKIMGNKTIFPIQAMSWAKKILWISGITLTIKNIHNVNLHNDYVVTPNHCSLMDIPVLIASIPSIRIMYKKDLEKVPIFGWIMKNSPFIPIVREERKKAFETIHQTIETMRLGSSVVVFPEGTRSTDGLLGEFKRGAFYLATKAEKPILPVGIIGTINVLPINSIKLVPNKVTLSIAEPIAVSTELSRAEEKALINTVRNNVLELITH